MIATENGYNVYVCGNGGASPRHGDLLASDIDEETVLKYLDRFLIYYISTADRLQRTAPWLDKLEGGIEHLKDVVINDKLKLNDEFEAQMQHIVDTYHDEWAEVVKSEKRRRRFSQFANSPETQQTIEFVEERGQWRPAYWAKDISWTMPEDAKELTGQEAWVDLGPVDDFPIQTGTPVLYGGVQLAVFRYAENEWYSAQNMSPKRRAFVLAEGLLGSADGVPKIACPLHKNQFALTTGECLDDPSLQIMTFDVRVIDGRVEAFLPPTSKLDSVLATEDNYLRAIETEGLISSKLDSILDAEMPGDFAVPPSTLAGVGNATAV
jgi:NAD(P)H-dependent nitrite reductase small subunit